MGLDMYARWREPEKRPNAEVDFETGEEFGDVEFFYWRKHPNLHGWMEELYRSKKGTSEDFNTDPVAITAADLDELEKALDESALPHTEGFFFGQSQPEDLKSDREFVAKARELLAEGKFIYYTSWW
jgi:hypothetical protein